ncbi:hypothetical protein [Rhizobium sp. CC-YZS058]|uniref:calcium-binding protein n=1 Tax=Rhizobium sp. CC-YZS058 TaxID=3042153 RepID=UPI002B061B0F|nr:hypothetical protein [Rhizobium sp. CC-YZS058]MEA3535625.1 hypothetical protein [Rhizobium sp. CC-YZS058]
MTITIKAGAATGVNVSAYLAKFTSSFAPVGRGQFSGADMVSGKQYAMTDSTGYGVVLGASKSDWSYSMTTHTVEGSLDSLSFGTSTVLDTQHHRFTQKAELSITGLGIEDSATANAIRSELGSKSTASLLAELASDQLVFKGSGGADVFKAYGFNDTLSGGAGNDVLWGNGGNDRLSGGAGDDTLVGGAGTDVLIGDAGHDVAKGGAGNDTIKGGAGNDRLFGDAGQDKLFGDAGNDVLNGGAGNDRLMGGAGTNTLTGGAGKDVFVFSSADSGRTTITDFEAGAGVGDQILLDRDILSSFAAVKDHAHQSGANLVIDYGEGSIVLRGVELADLARNDFAFV